MKRVIGSDRIRKNISIDDRRTSISLEAQIWNALSDICKRESVGIDKLCTMVAERRQESSMSSALRVFGTTYYQVVAEIKGDASNATPATGLGESGQEPIPAYFDIALERFAAEQKKYARSDQGSNDDDDND